MAKKFKITKADIETLDPKANDKFASAAKPGRVVNVSATSDDTGTGTIQFLHPDGTVEPLAAVTIPALAEGESLSIGVRIAATVRAAVEAEVSEVIE